MKKVIFMTMLMVFGLVAFSVPASMAADTVGEYIDDSVITVQVNETIVKDPDAHYLKIDVTTTQGDVVLQGFVNSRATEERLIGKTREIKGVKSVKSLLTVEEKK